MAFFAEGVASDGFFAQDECLLLVDVTGCFGALLCLCFLFSLCLFVGVFFLLEEAQVFLPLLFFVCAFAQCGEVGLSEGDGVGANHGEEFFSAVECMVAAEFLDVDAGGFLFVLL